MGQFMWELFYACWLMVADFGKTRKAVRARADDGEGQCG